MILEREQERKEREREGNTNVRGERETLTGAYCTCLDWALNTQPFGVWDNGSTN